MQKNYSFTVPSNDNIVEDTEKLVGRMTRSEMVREGLRLLNEKIKKDGSRPCPLPGERHFETFLHESSISTIEESLLKARHLVSIAENEKRWRKVRIKV